MELGKLFVFSRNNKLITIAGENWAAKKKGRILGQRRKVGAGQFSSVAQSCLTLYDPMNCSMPGLPVHHQLPESTQTHVHWVDDASKYNEFDFYSEIWEEIGFWAESWSDLLFFSSLFLLKYSWFIMY